MADRLTVVHLLHTVNFGGIETIIIHWLRVLDPEKIDVSIVCFANPGNTEEPFVLAAENAGFSVQKIRWNRSKPILRSSAELKKILIDKQADILHTHNTYADIVGLATRTRMNIKLVNSLYVWADFGWKRNILQWINQKVLRYFDRITVQCQATLEETVKRGIKRNKIRILHSGFTVNTLSMSAEEIIVKRAKLGFKENDIVLVNIARFYPEKAQDKLLLSFKKINDEFPDARLLMLGTGPLQEDLYALAQSLDITHAVHFAGFIDDLDAMLKIVDIQVHPSYAEGIPMAILSGMAAGLPIVASTVGGINEVITNDKNGVLVPSAGASDFDKQFVTKLKSLINNKNAMENLGNNARVFIQNEYSLEVAADTLEQIYHEVI